MFVVILLTYLKMKNVLEPIARGAVAEPKADLIPASLYETYSVGSSIRQFFTKKCFTMIYIIQVCSDFRKVNCVSLAGREAGSRNLGLIGSRFRVKGE